MPGNRSLQQQQAWEFTHQAELFHTPERVENHWGAIHTWLDCWWCNIFGNRTMLLNQNDGTFSGTDGNFEIWKNHKRHLQASQHNGALYNGAWSLFLNLLILIAWTNGGIYLHAFKQYHSPKQCLLSARPEEHIKWNEMYYDERWGRWMDP